MLVVAGTELGEHPALRFVAEVEPEQVLPYLTFAGGDQFLRDAGDTLAPCFERFLGADATRGAEWVARIGLGALALTDRPRLPHRPRRAARVRPCVRAARPPHPRTREEVTVMAISNEELIGRTDLDDVEAILAISNADDDATAHAVTANSDALFTWDYERTRAPLAKLYEKAKTSQWNANDLPWDTDVDQEKVVEANQAANAYLREGVETKGTPFESWGDKEWIAFGVQSQNWTLSQFLHGEQGALICTAQIVETVPWIDAKYYASTQVMDEARHVEVFSRYLDTKLSGHYPINAHLGALLDDIISDNRWDMTYLGMQIMVEGLALASFGYMHQMSTEPLLKQLLRYVMSDEARHVAFGVLSLQEYYEQLSASGDPRAPGVRLRGRGAHARPVPPAGGLGADGRRREGGGQVRAAGTRPSDLHRSAVLQDRPELPEARAPRRRRRLAARPVHRARRDRVRALDRHRRGVRGPRRGGARTGKPPSPRKYASATRSSLSSRQGIRAH